MESVADVQAGRQAAARSIVATLLAPGPIGAALVVVSFVVYLLCNRQFNASHGDFFYLADAFLHGRTWLEFQLGPSDSVVIGNHVYVPFAPFPAILVLPLVALVGPDVADKWQPIVNAALAAVDVGLMWILAGRIGVRSLGDRLWLAVLLGFSTAIWWVTTRGGVWHTGHLVATMLTLGILIELFGRQRLFLVGLLGGAAFLSRAPLLFAMPFYALWSFVRKRTGEGLMPVVYDWSLLVAGFMPFLAFFLWYNEERFGSPFESGYGLASLPGFLELQRQQGLFSLVHLPMNLDYLLWHLPAKIPDFPFFRPDGQGMSIFITSPGLLLAIRAPWRDRRTWLLAGAFFATLLPSLLYYGGGWLQYGYRYAIDAIPFAMALAAMAVVREGRIQLPWKALILFGLVINAAGVYWAYNF